MHDLVSHLERCNSAAVHSMFRTQTSTAPARPKKKGFLTSAKPVGTGLGTSSFLNRREAPSRITDQGAGTAQIGRASECLKVDLHRWSPVLRVTVSLCCEPHSRLTQSHSDLATLRRRSVTKKICPFLQSYFALFIIMAGRHAGYGLMAVIGFTR
jgi:hypothetical protein